MDKKNRTGLQSKISQIFAGVPMPRKKKPQSENAPEEKVENSGLLQEQQNNAVIEHGIAEPPPSVQDENIIELTLTEEPVAEQTQGKQPVEKLTEQKTPAIDEVSPSIQQLDEELSDELFTVVQDPDIETKSSENVKTGGSEKVERKFSDKVTQSGPPDKKDNIERLLTPQISAPWSSDSQEQMKKPSQPESKISRPSLDKAIPASPVKEPGAEKPATLPAQKSGAAETRVIPGAQKQPVGKVSRTETASKKDLTVSRQLTPKTKSKYLKVKTGAVRPKQKTAAGLLIALSIVLIVVVVIQLGVFSNSKEPGIIQNTAPPVKINKTSSGVTIDWKTPPAYPDNIRDPMIISDTVKNVTEKRDFTVKGISYVEGRYLVLIGTNLLKAGDEIYGAKIKNVTAVQVEFERDGVSWTQAVGE